MTKKPNATQGARPRKLLGRSVLVRNPGVSKGIKAVVGVVIGLYEVDERYVIVQAFPIGKPAVQLGDVQIVDGDPGETGDSVAWFI
jgi:hypothetical protein